MSVSSESNDIPAALDLGETGEALVQGNLWEVLVREDGPFNLEVVVGKFKTPLKLVGVQYLPDGSWKISFSEW